MSTLEDYPDYTIPVVHVGAVTVEGSVSVLGTVSVSGTVSVEGTVSVSGTVSVEGTVTVSGTVSIEGTVTVTGTVSISGTVTVEGTVSVTGTVNVSGEVNIKTAAVDNIVIDKLTVGAYTEDRRILSNNATGGDWFSPGTTYWYGKFFPRGCRGFIHQIYVFCDNQDGASHNFTVKVAPQPGMAAIIEKTLTVPAGSSGAWRSVDIKEFWNYDSMFIYARADHATYPRLLYDTGEPRDCHQSGDEVTWEPLNRRLWYRVHMTMETVGDLPVSGTVNTVEIPSTVAARQFVRLDVPGGEERYDTAQVGSGGLLIALFRVDDKPSRNHLHPRIKIDGEQVMPVDAPFYNWKHMFISPETPGITVSKWDTLDDRYCLVVTIPFPFKRRLEVGFYNEDSNPHTGYVAYSYKKIT
ncbi:MAG: polymer-forming cytoskeletal protein [Deltaproteobacteria bacterium]|nr:polymer-forming cytoskeletal protein [Deltaproteobacteria bacterium]